MYAFVDMQKALMTKVNAIDLKMDKLSKKLGHLQNARVNDEIAAPSQEVIESMMKHFPLENGEGQKEEKAIEFVENKLKEEKKFRTDLVNIDCIQLLIFIL